MNMSKIMRNVGLKKSELTAMPKHEGRRAYRQVKPRNDQNYCYDD